MNRRDVHVSDWDGYVERHPWGWWFHTSHWLAFALAYSPQAEDRSFAVVDDAGAVRAVVPLLVEGEAQPHGGRPTAALLSDEDADVLSCLWGGDARFPRLAACETRPGQPVTDEGLGCEAWDTHVLDLARPTAEAWAAVRKSYHSLINKQRQRGVVVCGASQQQPDATWPDDMAERLHLAAAGRRTRSRETWRVMGGWVRDGRALVAFGLGDHGRPVGYAYAVRWKGWSYYLSGATLKRDLSHALVWALAEALALDGETRRFEVGWGERRGDTEKDRGIARFKAGFGGERMRVHLLSRTP